MRKAILLLICAAAAPASAQDVYREDISGLFYLSRDFGGGAARDDGFRFGFTVDHSYTPVNRLSGITSIGMAPLRQSLVDVEYASGAGNFSRFSIGGLDALTYNGVLHQNSGSSSRWPMGLSTTQVLIGGVVLIVGGYFAYDELSDDGEDTDD